MSFLESCFSQKEQEKQEAFPEKARTVLVRIAKHPGEHPAKRLLYDRRENDYGGHFWHLCLLYHIRADYADA